MRADVFVTGTDTGVGKTTVACALLRAAVALGHRALGMKPVSSGIAPGAAINADVEALHCAGNVDAPLALRNPYAFATAIAPHLAAQAAGVTIEIGRIRAAFDALALRAERVVVEGAGGALVPLGERGDMLDIARALHIPVVLVVGMRLGCVNHALLSALAIRARGLHCAGWIANAIDPNYAALAANIEALEERLPAPLLASCPWSDPARPQWTPAAVALGLA
ncbi:MAG: dethiobiotin synthase [Casimicrobiaceae bacterium]